MLTQRTTYPSGRKTVGFLNLNDDARTMADVYASPGFFPRTTWPDDATPRTATPLRYFYALAEEYRDDADEYPDTFHPTYRTYLA